MEKDKLKRLSHWWREVETASDEEALRRKLHLMEAEIRHTLRGAHAARKRQVLRNFYAAGLLGVVLLLSLGIARVVPPTDSLRYATTETGEKYPAVSEEVILAAPVQQPSLAAPAPDKPKASIREARQASASVRPKRPHAVARQIAPPAVMPTPPAEAPASVEPASLAPAPSTAKAKAEPEMGLDALALLSSLESEFEK